MLHLNGALSVVGDELGPPLAAALLVGDDVMGGGDCGGRWFGATDALDGWDLSFLVAAGPGGGDGG